MKPVTPLPWIFEDDLGPDASSGQTYRVHNGQPFNSMMGDPEYYNYALDKEDARYAVHAANAYPDLMAACRAAANAFALQALRDCADPDMLKGWRDLQALCQAALATEVALTTAEPPAK